MVTANVQVAIDPDTGGEGNSAGLIHGDIIVADIDVIVGDDSEAAHDRSLALARVYLLDILVLVLVQLAQQLILEVLLVGEGDRCRHHLHHLAVAVHYRLVTDLPVDGAPVEGNETIHVFDHFVYLL